MWNIFLFFGMKMWMNYKTNQRNSIIHSYFSFILITVHSVNKLEFIIHIYMYQSSSVLPAKLLCVVMNDNSTTFYEGSVKFYLKCKYTRKYGNLQEGIRPSRGSPCMKTPISTNHLHPKVHLLFLLKAP